MKLRKLLSLVLALVMIVGTLIVVPVTAGAAEGWDGETIAQPAGKGTKEEPFLISSAENLAWVSYMTKNPKELNASNAVEGSSYKSHDVFSGVYFVQTVDIDLGGHNFTPIGYKQSSVEARRSAFAGSYDGRNYKISNAVIRPEPKALTTNEYQSALEIGFRPGAIFGVIAAQASISNVHACNIKVGTTDTTVKSSLKAYDSLVSGVIVGVTYGNAKISGCTTDSACEAYGLYAAGGILGMADNGGSIKKCVNSAKIGSDAAAGGIVGCGYNTLVSHCLNRGAITLYATTRWASAGGIMGRPYAMASSSVVISNCINTAAATSAGISLQASGSQSNRIALGGIMGNDSNAAQVSISYLDCFNLQTTFSAKFIDNGNGDNCLAMAGGIVGNSKNVEGAGSRMMERCFSVAANLNEEVLNKGVATYACNYNQQAKKLNPSAYAGLIGAAMADTQVSVAWGDPTTLFATCTYGISADDLMAKVAYQETLALANAVEMYKNAPKYVGVQETLDKSAGKYGLRFIAGIDSSEYYEAGVEVTALYGDHQMATFKLTADQYHNSLSGKVDGKGVNYTAKELGGNKLMALKQTIDLTVFGAATYIVTPFSVKAQGNDTMYGKSWELCYNADGSFVEQHTLEEESEENTANNYTIVYPDNSVNATVYPVISLQHLVLSKTGVKMPLANEQSADPDAHEIVIAEDDTMEEGAYKTEVVGNRLIVTAGDMFGFIAASNRLTKSLFVSGTIKLNENCNTQGVYDREMLTERQGEHRVIFQNVWFRHFLYQFDSITNYEYQLAVIMSYLPDVIGLNEFREGWRNCGFVEAMRENGYIEVKPIVNGEAVNLDNPIFYRADTVEYIEGSAQYISYGKYNSVDTDYDGVGEPLLRNTGEFKGRYYDNSDDRNRTAHAASFRNKTTGEAYTVCCTHFESNGGVDPQVAPLGNPLRWENVQKLLPFLEQYEETYGLPILLGGDFNAKRSYPEGNYVAKGGEKSFTNNDLFNFYDGRQIPYLYGAIQMLVDEGGFLDCRAMTTDTAFSNSTNGYPIWNDDLQAFVAYDANLSDTGWAGAIDHIYARDPGGFIEPVLYRYASPETALASSDHRPVLMDFNIGEGGFTGGGSTDPDPDPEPTPSTPWQGMDDFTAPTKGNGTKDDPYLIENAQHLAWLSRMVEDAETASAFSGRTEASRRVFGGLFFRQTADIDLNNKEFMPIGSYMSATFENRHLFGGVYDGGGFKIMNAKISMADHVGKDYYKNAEAAAYAPPADPSKAGAAGHYDALFSISASAMIQNVNAVNIHVGNYDGQHTSSTAASIICGFAIEASVINCTTDETSTATAAHAAGILLVTYGGNGTKVQNCTNTATVTGTVKADGIWAYPLYEKDTEENCTDSGTVVEGAV